MTTFPSTLLHGGGTRMALDRSRLLVAFREPTNVDAAERLFEPAGLKPERPPQAAEKDIRAPNLINHTPNYVWAKTASGKPLDSKGITELGKLLEGRVEWLGPVYRLEGTKGLDGLLCPLPHVLIIKGLSAAPPQDKDLAAAVKRYGLTEVPEKSRYLNGFRYFLLDDPARHSVYEIRDTLLQKEKARLMDVKFENMPLLGDTVLVPNDTLYAQQWNLTQIDAPLGWDIETGNSSVVIAILDDGVQTNHPDLNCLPGVNLSTMLPTGDPGGNHGTACAGIAAARFNNNLGIAGVAPGCRILPLRRVTSSDVECAAGITWAADNGADVISMSFGRYLPGEGLGPTGWDFSLIDPAITHAFNVRGCVLCAATGNENAGTVNRYPARHPLVIGCGASDQVDNRKAPASPDGESWGSNFGQQTYNSVITGVSVVAPGVLIPTTDRQGAAGYNTAAGNAGDYFMMFNGTSSATPHVAGLAGLLLSCSPALTNVHVRNVIEQTAEKVGVVPYAADPLFPNGTRNQQMGYGRINIRAALQSCSKTFFKDFKDAMIDKVVLAEKFKILDFRKGNRWKEKEGIEEVKGPAGYENPEIFDPRILERIEARLEKLEKAVIQARGRSFIRESERPDVGAALSRRSAKGKQK